MPDMPLAVKLLYTVFVLAVVPVYWRTLGPLNFLWFSDIALFAIVVAMWLESSLIVSMQSISVLAFEIGWTVDFAIGLLVGRSPLGLSTYMFRSQTPRVVRGLSLFHLALPPTLLWLLGRWGYDSRALLAQTALGWIVMLASYQFTPPAKDVNWVFGLGGRPQSRLPPSLYLALLMVGLALLVYLPTHLLLRSVFESK